MHAMHLVCRQRASIACLKAGRFECGPWPLSPDDASRLVGGRLYLHECKAEPAFFGGTVVGARSLDKPSDSGNIALIFEPDGKAFGRRWRGDMQARARLSGLVEDDLDS